MIARPDTGDSMPDIALEGVDGTIIKPSQFRGRKLVLFFYPKDDTPGCTTENKDFSALADAFEQAGAGLLGVSKDPPAKHAKFTAKHDLTVPLATDSDGGLSDALGVWGEKSLYGKLIDGTIRSTIVVGPDGRVTNAFYNVKATGHVGRLRRDLGIE